MEWYTGSGGYYRLKNRASGKYLRPLGGSAGSDVNLVQHTYVATLASEQWRFDQTDAADAALQARTALATALAPSPPGLQAYPNPVSESLIIRLDADAGQATLRGLSGRLCLSQAVGRTAQLDVRTLPAGIYLLTLTTATGQIRQKVVKK